MQKFDLQLHSTCSDGVNSPTQLMHWCAELGLETVALTDHDTISGVKEAQCAAREKGIKCVSAVELTVEVRIEGLPSTLDILGYGFATFNQTLNTLLDTQQRMRDEWMHAVRDALTEKGFALPSFDAKSTRTLLFRKVFSDVANEEVLAQLEISAASDLLQFISGIDRRYVSFPEAVYALRNAGGIIVCSSEFGTEVDPEKYHSLLELLMKCGIKGVECFHPSLTEEQSQKLFSCAKALKLIVTGSSDYHSAPRNDKDPSTPGDWKSYGLVTKIDSTLVAYQKDSQ